MSSSPRGTAFFFVFLPWHLGIFQDSFKHKNHRVLKMKRVPRPQELVLDCKENSACCPLSMKGSPLPVACYWLVVGQNRICATMIQQPGGAQATRRHTPPGEIFHHGGGGGQFPSLPLYGLQHKVPGLFKAHLVNQHSGGYCGQGGGLLDCRWEGLSGRSRELLHVGEGGGRRGWADEPHWRAHAVNFYALLSFVSRQTTVRWQDRANAHAFFFSWRLLKHTPHSLPLLLLLHSKPVRFMQDLSQQNATFLGQPTPKLQSTKSKRDFSSIILCCLPSPTSRSLLYVFVCLEISLLIRFKRKHWAKYWESNFTPPLSKNLPQRFLAASPSSGVGGKLDKITSAAKYEWKPPLSQTRLCAFNAVWQPHFFP